MAASTSGTITVATALHHYRGLNSRCGHLDDGEGQPARGRRLFTRRDPRYRRRPTGQQPEPATNDPASALPHRNGARPDHPGGLRRLIPPLTPIPRDHRTRTGLEPAADPRRSGTRPVGYGSPRSPPPSTPTATTLARALSPAGPLHPLRLEPSRSSRSARCSPSRPSTPAARDGLPRLNRTKKVVRWTAVPDRGVPGLHGPAPAPARSGACGSDLERGRSTSTPPVALHRSGPGRAVAPERYITSAVDALPRAMPRCQRVHPASA